jgi:hypothetical protein
MKKRYVVELTREEREDLFKLISRGSASARKLNRARILLKADVGEHSEGEALSDRDIAGTCSKRLRPPWGGCASGSSARGWTPPSNARHPIESTRGPSTGGQRLA